MVRWSVIQRPGKYRRTRLFVLTLGYSRKAVRLLVWQSSTQIWAELHERAFRRLGGTVRVIVLDNLKEGVLTPDIYDPALNPLYRDVLAHYGRHQRHGTTKRQVAAMFAEERPALGSLPLEPFRYYRFGVRTVQLDGCVEVEARTTGRRRAGSGGASTCSGTTSSSVCSIPGGDTEHGPQSSPQVPACSGHFQSAPPSEAES
jgi:hypothetical protein